MNRYIVQHIAEDGSSKFTEFTDIAKAISFAHVSIGLPTPECEAGGWTDADPEEYDNCIWRKVNGCLEVCVFELKWEYNPDDWGYLLEYLDETTGKWRASELANNYCYEVYEYGRPDYEEWEQSEIHTEMFAEHPAWCDVCGDDWTDRLGLHEWERYNPSECEGDAWEYGRNDDYSEDHTKKIMREHYRIRKVRLGRLSKSFMDFTREHPWISFVKKDWLPGCDAESNPPSPPAEEDHRTELRLTEEETKSIAEIVVKELEEWKELQRDYPDDDHSVTITALEKLLASIDSL